jgi:phospholipid/cholesterol/gamma-HCH transport system substrate-binding protein
MEGLSADYQLIIDIRAFQVAGRDQPAEIELAAKLLGNSGRILAGKAFAAKVPAASAEAPAAIAALDEAFGKVAVDLAAWVGNVLQGSPAPKR